MALGGASTPAQAALKFHRLAQSVPDMKRTALNANALAVKKSVQGELQQAAPRGRLNVGKRGKRIGVRYDNKTGDSALVYAFGPAHLIESNTKAHQIPRERVRGRRTRRGKRLFIPGVGVRMSAKHPGTKGKHPWARGVREGLQKLDRVNERVLRNTVRQVFR